MERIEIDPNHPKLKDNESSISTAIAKFNYPADVALSIQQQFEPFEKQANEWKEKAMAMVVTDVNDKQGMQEARAARLALRQVRLSVKDKYNELKEESRRKGQMLDLINRTLTSLIEPLEAHLQEQEDYAEVQAAKQKQALIDDRLKQLEPYRTPGDGMNNLPLGDIPEETFISILGGLQAAKTAKEAAAKEAERIRLENKQKTKEERERNRKEAEKIQVRNNRINYILSKMGLTWDEEFKHYRYDDIVITMQDINDLTTQEFQELVTALTPMVKEKKEAERKKLEDEKAELERNRQALQKLEQEKKEREAKEEAERKRAAAEKRKLARQPDKVKLLAFVDRITNIEGIEGLKDDEANRIYRVACGMLNKTKEWLTQESEKL
jgi:hypothetical protein